MKINEDAPHLIEILNEELRRLGTSHRYTMAKERLVEILAAIGPSNVEDLSLVDAARRSGNLPMMSVADLVRARMAILTARKVEPLWAVACMETDSNVDAETDPDDPPPPIDEDVYRQARMNQSIESISAVKVPRSFIPSHILEMAEEAFHRRIVDQSRFIEEAHRWWHFYGRPEFMERECFIKSAAHEALYESMGWANYDSFPPARSALLAFAGIFEGLDIENRSYKLDEAKEHSFWTWWVEVAIPTALSDMGIRRV